MTEGMTGKVTTVMHDTTDIDEVVAFWSKVLGLEVKHKDETYAYLGGLTESGPNLAFQKVPESKEGKNRLHLDVMVEDREAFAEWVEELGGRRIEEHDHPGWPIWIIMADPQGNEFCIYEKQDSAA